jgi:hypothetical protein
MALDMTTQKVGRNVQGTLCAVVEKGTNVFDDSAILEQQKRAILKAFRKLTDEWMLKFDSTPTACSMTSGDQSRIAEAWNEECSSTGNKKVDRWAESVVIDGITIKNKCAVKDGVVTLHQFE